MMKKITLIILGLVTLNVKTYAQCDNVYFDLIKGTINNIGPDASMSLIKKELPCFTGETAEGEVYNYGGGVFFIKNDFYIYTFKNFIEVRSGFKGRVYPDIMNKSQAEVQQILKPYLTSINSLTGKYSVSGEIPFKLNNSNFLYYKNEVGFLVIKFSKNKVSSIYSIYSPTNAEKIDKTAPKITILSPNVARGLKVVEQKKEITIKGKATDTSGIYDILINGEAADVDVEGNFSKTVQLALGTNTFTVKAIDRKQNTATETFVIERNSSRLEYLLSNKQESKSAAIQTGTYYALIIGNNMYHDPAITSLNEPINDAKKLYKVLTTEYTFEPKNVSFLNNATYVQMIEAFDELSNKITDKDNLLVFYAGHGWWDENKKLGYWLPIDAKQKSTAYWIANSRISDYMRSINTKHTLLIADACFSGSIFKTRAAFSDAGNAINSLYELPSRSAMTSGNLKEVPDKSVFLEYLVKRLDNNSEKYLSADQLFSSFRIAVMNNSQTEPQFGIIQNAGDEGGEFIFIRRDE